MPSNFNNQELTEIKFNGVDVSEAYFNNVLVFDSRFISTWRTTTANETITLPTPTNYEVDWGDGTSTTNANSHVYSIAGDYEIKIRGSITDFAFNNGGDKVKILQISRLNKLRINEGSFYGALNLDIIATDLPIIENGFNVFRGNSSLLYNNSINDYDVSNITDLTNFFFGCTNFNQNINNWFIDNKIDLGGTFRGCTNFNQPLNNWNVLNVQFMNNLFYACTNFNQDISNWNVENVRRFNQCFLNCTNFDQPLNSWNTLSCVDSALMFYNCTNFNKPLNNWVTTSFVNMSFMFFGCTNFNQNINGWDTQNVNTLYRTFRLCTNFNQPLNNWDTSKVSDMVECFYFCTSFNQNVSDWSFVSVTNMSSFMLGKTENDYDANYLSDLLIKLDQDLVFANMVNVNLGFGTIKYDSTGVTAYNSLISKGFIITSGGQV